MDPLDADVFISTPRTFFTLKTDEEPSWLERHPHHSAHEKPVNEETLSFFGDHLKAYELRDYNPDLYKHLCQYKNLK